MVNIKESTITKKATGLILEGGANRGVFTAGVLDCLQDHHIYLPYVVAVSAGSFNAMDYTSHQKGRSRDCMIPNGRNKPPIHWTHFFRKKGMIDFDLAFDEYPNRMIPFDYEAYEASDMLCEYVVTDCHSGKAIYLSEKHDGKRLMQIARASCSVPFVCPMTKLDGNLYLDGGISDSIPIHHAMSKGYQKNIVILTREKDYQKKATGKPLHIARLMYRKYPALIKQLETRNKRYNDTIKVLEELEANHQVLIIRPSKVLVSRADNHTDRLQAFYEQGYQIAKDSLEAIKKFLEEENEKCVSETVEG